MIPYAQGRPGASSRAYSQPGVAKPAVPRGQAGAAVARPSARAQARQLWSRVFGGPHFLDPGPSNRLILSIRSGIPAEIDFGLDRLVQVTSVDPDLVRLVDFPGLLDGCLALIADYIERRRADRAQGTPALSSVVGEDSRDLLRRRAGEAALILRNVAPESRSKEPLLASKKLLKAICAVLDEGETGSLDVEETTEVRLYLLDVLECIAEHIPLALPGHAIRTQEEETADENQPPPKPEPLDSPAVRLFPLLVSLTRTKDRALILAGFRCLTALAMNEKSDSVFALLTYEAVEPLPKPHPHPIQTAIELLPIADAELSLAVLEFVYQHTLLPSNAVFLGSRPELLGILRLLCSKFHAGSRVEEITIDLNASPAAIAQANRHPRKAVAQAAGDGNLLTRDELKQIVQMPEPARALTWMRLVYEADPAADIPQVSLWTTYQAQFAPRMAAGVPPMLSASDAIKMSQQAIPDALPMVHEGAEKKFVIRGMKLKQRPEVADVNRCLWADCPAPSGYDSPAATYHHVYDTHLASTPSPSSCKWDKCAYMPSISTDPALVLGDLSLHVRTHLDSFSSHSSSSASAAAEPAPYLLRHERYHTFAAGEGPADAGATNGLGFFAALAVRNLGRIAKLAVDAALAAGGGSAGKGASGSALVASGNSAIGRLAGEQQSIFEAFAAAEEGSAKQEGVLARLEKVDFARAKPLAVALVALQPRLNETVMRDVALGKILGETVVQVEECRRALLRLNPPKEAPMQSAESQAQQQGDDVEMRMA
ncbi:hypothetical protein Rhopal_002637-T1 [Rhodotorula paludigena]|uniref:RFX-type winged-helix domain-containing protein n=1 Tax=Rhodotorula paludigena TaxID=86838 RepID=A0AAV5GIK5_9BASI|nr:hypothetical protein Rhopal_002637-T1 [Rhodotorula paludigena]